MLRLRIKTRTIIFLAFSLILTPVFEVIAFTDRVWYPHLLFREEGIVVNGETESIPEADEIHFTITGQNSVTFDWRGSADTIHFGVESKKYDTHVRGEEPSLKPTSSPFAFHEAKLRNLKEDTLYYYAIGNTEEHTFHTPPFIASDSTFSIAVQGDISESKSNPAVTEVQNLIAGLQTDFVIVTGDLAYNNQTGRSAVDRHFNDVMAWSRNQAYMPIWGNHEHAQEPEQNYINYVGRFDLPNPQASPNPEMPGSNEDWYWFDYGNTRFIAYPEPTEGAWEDWQEKMLRRDGLMQQAENDDRIRYIVTFGHRPAYSSGKQKSEEALQKILDSLGDRYSKYVLNLNGHSHNYERVHPQHGVTYLTVGTGGKDLQKSGENPECHWRDCTPPSWSAQRFMRHGALKLTFEEDQIRGEFFCGPADPEVKERECRIGEVIDQFIVKPGGD